MGLNLVFAGGSGWLFLVWRLAMWWVLGCGRFSLTCLICWWVIWSRCLRGCCGFDFGFGFWGGSFRRFLFVLPGLLILGWCGL